MDEGDGRLPHFQANGSTSTHLLNKERGRDTEASRANAMDVYEDAVQEPLLECTNLASMYYNAQEIGSKRPDARILREDFCSSAIVAQTWLGLDKENRSQGVDIDLDALKIAQKRTFRSKRRARLVQSVQYSSTGNVQFLNVENSKDEKSMLLDDTLISQVDENVSSSTWDDGVASDRFERKFKARQAKAQLAEARSRASTPDRIKGDSTSQEEVMTLFHADVLSLPIDGVSIDSPDLVYAGNYALSYFHDRKSLLAYLRQCRNTLRPETGVLIVDPFAGPTSWDANSAEERYEQDELWSKFANEAGFLRSQEGDPPLPLRGEELEFWSSKHQSFSGSDWRSWPRGRLVLVRSGQLYGGYEYWREDGPIDYTTNQFRMSLSFRFTRDNSWLRDYFSYDFRVWSLREITEAMEEVGFERIQVHAIPRVSSSPSRTKNDDSGESESGEGEEEGNDNDSTTSQTGMEGMAGLMKRTEKQESEKITFQHLEEGQKLFASKSFGTYIIACMP